MLDRISGIPKEELSGFSRVQHQASLCICSVYPPFRLAQNTAIVVEWRWRRGQGMSGAASRAPAGTSPPEAVRGAGPGSLAAAPTALQRHTDASCRTAGEGEMFANKSGICMLYQLLLLYFNRDLECHQENYCLVSWGQYPIAFNFNMIPNSYLKESDRIAWRKETYFFHWRVMFLYNSFLFRYLRKISVISATVNEFLFSHWG